MRHGPDPRSPDVADRHRDRGALLAQKGARVERRNDLGLFLSTTRAEPELKKAIVVEGWITLEVEEVPEVADHIRARVQELGGSIVNDQMTGGEAHMIAARVIEEAGYGDNFGHGLGHGVGLNITVQSYLDSLDQEEAGE